MNGKRLILVFASTAIVSSGFVYWSLNRFFHDIPAPLIPISDSLSADEVNGLTRHTKQEWTTSVLRRFKENPIDSIVEADDVYRLILFPTFDKPLMVSAIRSGETKVLVTKQLDGDGGFGNEELGQLSHERSRELLESEWELLLEHLERSGFWYIPTLDQNDEPVNDGAFWVLEGRNGDLVHSVQRISPNRNLGSAFTYIIELAGQKSNYEEYFYFK